MTTPPTPVRTADRADVVHPTDDEIVNTRHRQPIAALRAGAPRSPGGPDGSGSPGGSGCPRARGHAGTRARGHAGTRARGHAGTR
jgi:hypothetical protein